MNLFLAGGAVVESSGAWPAILVIDGSVSTLTTDHQIISSLWDSDHYYNYQTAPAANKVNSMRVVGMLAKELTSTSIRIHVIT